MTTQDLLLVESEVTEVYEAPFSPNYNVHSKLFDTRHVVKAYTSQMTIDSMGWIKFKLIWKNGKSQSVKRPFHFMKNDVLYVMKKYKHKMSDSFALNHDLFTLDWKVCVILHFFEDKPYYFISSREEWIENGTPNQQNQELQVFLEVPDCRRLPSTFTLSDNDWLHECLAVMRIAK